MTFYFINSHRSYAKSSTLGTLITDNVSLTSIGNFILLQRWSYFREMSPEIHQHMLASFSSRNGHFGSLPPPRLRIPYLLLPLSSLSDPTPSSDTAPMPLSTYIPPLPIDIHGTDVRNVCQQECWQDSRSTTSIYRLNSTYIYGVICMQG